MTPLKAFSIATFAPFVEVTAMYFVTVYTAACSLTKKLYS
jgi:hypothetical protein